ncbi:MAG: hypothetical protein GF408_01965 [Candidatus Omnitrophica bacterium]|nr:hypothetical protein [Candidatus Omnitrophota bacterium]
MDLTGISYPGGGRVEHGGNVSYVPSCEGLAEKVSGLFAEADAHVKRFRKKTAIDCPEGCGVCCEKKDLEMTVLEFMPLAVQLWGSGEAELFLEALESRGDKVCILYGKGTVPGYGRCVKYGSRGLLCRLFGFAAVRDKASRPHFATCRIVKLKFPELFEGAERTVSLGYDAPFISSYYRRLLSIDPFLGTKTFPVNTAIRLAIEKVGFARQNFEKYAG